MKKAIVLVFAILFLVAAVAGTAYAGWKENYREKYSKKTLDPNSEKAKKIRSLGNFDFKFNKWTKTPEERRAQGLEPKKTLGENLMPWRKEESRDKFVEQTQNFSPAVKEIPDDEGRIKTGDTLGSLIKTMGGAFMDGMEEQLAGGETK